LSSQTPWYAEFSYDSLQNDAETVTKPRFSDAETLRFQIARAEKAREDVLTQLASFPSLREKPCVSILKSARQIAPVSGQPLLSAMETYFCHAFFLSSFFLPQETDALIPHTKTAPAAQILTQGGVSLSLGGRTKTPPAVPIAVPAETSVPSPAFSAVIDRSFGSYGQFLLQWQEQAESVSGSGFLWLIRTAAPKLSLYVTRGEETPYTAAVGLLPVLCLDLWEHAYFLRYRGDVRAYASAFLSSIRWETAETRYSVE